MRAEFVAVRIRVRVGVRVPATVETDAAPKVLANPPGCLDELLQVG